MALGPHQLERQHDAVEGHGLRRPGVVRDSEIDALASSQRNDPRGACRPGPAGRGCVSERPHSPARYSVYIDLESVARAGRAAETADRCRGFVVAGCPGAEFVGRGVVGESYAAACVELARYERCDPDDGCTTTLAPT